MLLGNNDKLQIILTLAGMNISRHIVLVTDTQTTQARASSKDCEWNCFLMLLPLPQRDNLVGGIKYTPFLNPLSNTKTYS